MPRNRKKPSHSNREPKGRKRQGMNPRNSAKDVMQICDLCETNVVQMHCDACLVYLCRACVEEHLNSDATKTHKLSERVSVVNKGSDAKLTLDPQTSAQDVLRCDNCETNEINLQCKTCLVYLCTTHVGEHIISDKAKDHNIVVRQSKTFNPFTKQGVDFPVILYCEPKEVADVVTVLRTIEDIYPEASDASLTHHLLQSLHLDEFRSRLKSLESKVILVDPGNLCEDRHAGDGRVCIYKVEVKSSYGQLTVYEPKVSLDQFRSIHHLPKSFLVTSNSESVIETKLAVDEKYHYMLEEKVRIFHESDPNKKLFLLCTKYTIDSFKNRVEKLINSIPINELHQIVNRAADIAFSEKEIQKGIQDIYIVSEGHYIGSVDSGSCFCRSPFKIGQIREKLISETLQHIGKQFTDMLLIGILKNIQNTLEAEFSHMVCTINIRDDSLMNPKGILIFAAGLVSFVARVLNPVLGIIVSVFTILPAVLTFFQPVNVNSAEWRNKVANEIYMNISAKKYEITADVFRKLKSICDQTKKELREISVKLATASRRISLVD